MLLFKKKQDGESAKPKVKMVKETKCTCNSCGKVWYFGETRTDSGRCSRRYHRKLGLPVPVLGMPFCYLW